MTEDLIKDNFCIEVDKHLINKNIRLIKIVLAVLSLYLIMGGYLWTKVLITKPVFMKIAGLNLLEYLLTPIVLFITVLANFIAIVCCLKGNRLIQQSFAQNDAGLFNKGYKQFYKSGILGLFIISISLIHGLFKVFIF